MQVLNILLIILMFTASILSQPFLPAKIPMHWNIKGEIDSYMPKELAVWVIPALALVMLILFKLLPYLDPKKANYKLFKKEWNILQTALIAFMAYMQLITFYIAIHPEVSLMPLFFIGFGVLFVLLGKYLSKIKQNYFIGFKIPWTLASEENWDKTHKFAGTCFMVVGVITVIEAFFIWYALFVIFGGIFLAALLPVIYSFLIYKKAVNKMKFVYISIVSVILAVALIRLLSGEDDWICKNGKWVKHGNPSVAAPQRVCK